jgi:putative transcriptional regulator
METCLRHHFLLAMPTLSGSYFGQTITYLAEHNEDGALGLIVNREVEDVRLGEVFDQLEIDGPEHRDAPVLEGGPVQRDRGFVLHATDDPGEDAVRLPDGLALSTSREILVDLAAGRGPSRFLVCVGYAGWGAGQLEEELADNAWLTCPADERILFDVPFEQRIDAAAGKLGIDFNLISGVAGHA